MTLRRDPFEIPDSEIRPRQGAVRRRRVRGALAAAIVATLLSAVVFSAQTSLAQQEQQGGKSDRERQMEALKAIPYVSWTEQKVDSSESGVTLYDTLRAYRGYTMYITKTGAALVDMEGNEVHSWSNSRLKRLEHVRLLPDGDVDVVLPREGIYRLNWDGDIVWSVEAPVHHDFDIAPNGDIISLAYDEVVIPDIRPQPVLTDKLVRIEDDGTVTDIWRLSEHRDELRRWCSEEALSTISEDVPENDWSHMNTVELIGSRRTSTALGGAGSSDDARSPDQSSSGSRHIAFRPGNALVCIRNLDFVGVVNLGTGEIEWGWGPGELDHPHEPSVLPNGDILVFDNGFFRGWSRVVEYDPVAEQIVWEYKAPDPFDFFSRGRGSAQMLPNDDVLITESAKGRVFEVTRGGDVVWNFLNPNIQRERRGTLYRSFRYDPGPIEALLDAHGVQHP